MISESWIADSQGVFRRALDGFAADRPALVLSHDDADGLASGALLAQSLSRAGRPAEVRLVGRGESAWSEAMASELRDRAMGGLIVADLGLRPGLPRDGMPTVLIDHHVPAGIPDAGATVISGHGLDPTPSTSLLAWWCGGALGDAGDLLWLAAIGLIGDLGDRAPFEELASARKRCGATALREAVSLLNAPRRAAAGDARPAFDLLMKASGPKDIASGVHPETAILRAAREEVRAAVEAGRRVAPKVRGGVALIRLHSPCQIHPLVAQAWTGRLKGQVVIAANTGYRPGWVHFAARGGPPGTDLIAFLRERAPASADENYGQGHVQATGGALRPEAWAEFQAGLGFGA
jgi:single-stranded-DNA-specific exonuclease